MVPLSRLAIVPPQVRAVYVSITDKSNEYGAWFKNTLPSLSSIELPTPVIHSKKLPKFSLVTSTPFGLPVLPEVNIIYATSLGSISFISLESVSCASPASYSLSA